ncbi:MAG: metallophosphoesterase family protein [Candidatus Thorarchaeota archaeon]|jgi:Icc-related predicted phosphoesterase
MSPVKIAAIADVHSPRFLNDFNVALSKCEKPDLFLFAGDMINRGNEKEYKNVLDTVDSQLGSDFPITACFGNEDLLGSRDELHLMTKDRLTFLDEKSITLNLHGSRIAIVGLSAVGAELLEAQSNTVAEIQTIFEERALQLSQLLQGATSSSDYVILLMHFSPLLETNPAEFSWWISRAMETSAPNLIIHGHIHNSTRTKIEIGATTIRNVALPAVGSITELNIWDTKED